jgi:hypothetical protein
MKTFMHQPTCFKRSNRRLTPDGSVGVLLALARKKLEVCRQTHTSRHDGMGVKRLHEINPGKDNDENQTKPDSTFVPVRIARIGDGNIIRIGDGSHSRASYSCNTKRLSGTVKLQHAWAGQIFNCPELDH